MKNSYHAVFEKDGDWYVGFCLEFPGANGQGKTIEECRQSLSEAIELLIYDRAEDFRNSVSDNAIQEMISV
jgi:predicted RNase H-like HicB family nuclease